MKKTMKKILCTLLVVVMCVTTAPLQGFVGFDWSWLDFSVKASATEGYAYTILDGEATIIHGDRCVSGDVTIPSTIDGYSVTSIGYHAFYGCTGLTSITIPDSVTSIGEWAFYDCTGLTSITIPNGVTSIGEGAFGECTGLTSITIPNSIISIDSRAFCDCTGLTSITIPNSVTFIGYDAFNNTGYYNNTSNWNNKVLYIDNHLIKALDSITTHDIKQGTKTITSDAFYGCTGLTSITIPDSVTSIGEWAFGDCTGLTSITIPDSVTSIGAYAFYNTAYYNNISNWNNKVLYIDNHLIKALDSITTHDIKQGTKTITSDAFFGCKALTSITIPDSVTSIGMHAFCGCTSLTSVTIPDSVTSIDQSAFSGCTGLTSITIPNSVTSIGDHAFRDCTELTSIAISDSVTSIGEWAFYGCTGLTSITIPNGVTSIGELAFRECTGLTSITIPNSVTSIGYAAFHGCTGLTSITIPDSVTSIGDYAFGACTGLASITIPDSVTYIGCGAFSHCTGLTSITIPDSLTSIVEEAFYGCTGLTSITIPDSLTSIDYYAFWGCTNLKDVYYMGTEEQWNKISIEESNEDLINATIHYNSGYISSENIKEKLDNVIGVDYTFTYNDNYFSNSSYTYNHDLAIMSNCLAISAMIKANSDSYPTCAESFFEKLRFDNYTPYGYGVSPQYNSIACAIASKNLDNTDETIIAIGVRGAGYDSEWGGNFNIGTKEEHEGFRLAKEGVLGYLSEFIKDNKKDFNSNVKFWISGYSRAAATSNLVAAALDEGTNGYDYISSLNYGPEDVYAYTFETPIPTRDKNTKNALYNNIFNIINRIDYVPKVAPETWGYSRYGVDCFLPSPETYGKEYSTLFNKMKAQHKAINGKDYTEKFTFYDAKFSVNTNDILNSGFDVSFVSPNGNVSQSRYLDEFITIFAKYVLKNVETYTNKYQSSIQKLMISALGGGFEEVKIPENTKSEIRSALFEGIKSKIFNMNNSVWRSSLTTIISNIEEISLTYTDAYNLLGIVDEALITSIGSYNYVYTLIENASDIMPAHFPEMNFAWLTALDGETIKQSINGKYYRVIKYNCPIDIKLYDEDDNLLATICGDNIEISEDCYLSIYIDADGQKCFCLPEDTEYRFEIIGTDEGTMNCSFSEYDFTKGENTETVNYYDVPVKEDTTFVVELDRKEDNDNNESFANDIVIVNENEEVIDSDEIITEEESTEITVTVISNSENSVAVGGGYYKKGEFAKIETLSNGNEVFVGWYVNDNLLSTESTCRFMPENDCVIIAKWTSYCNIHGHTDSEWFVDKDSTCSAEGSKHIECTVCEEVLKTEAIATLPHNYSSVIKEATCETGGYTTYTCTCGDTYTGDKTPAKGHSYAEGVCTACGESKVDNCSCNCHKGGFMGFIWKIINFFNKLFKTNKTCSCGVSHY